MWCLLLVVVLGSAAVQARPRNDTDYRHIWTDVCGVSKYDDAGYPWADSQIIGGITAREHEFPWQASIRWYPGRAQEHNCGAVLIHKRWVVTAAHCIITIPTTEKVIVLGEWSAYKDNPARRTYGIETYYVHERYGMDQWYDKDMALIRLDEDAELSENIMPACAPDPNYLYVRERAVISGWGTMVSGDWVLPMYLMWITVPIPSNKECDDAMGGGITDYMICAGRDPEYERDACNGDSGGPMVVKRDDGIFELPGLVSWGAGCASGPPGVYIRVSKFREWVSEKMALHGD